jgi:hypothetical protein
MAENPQIDSNQIYLQTINNSLDNVNPNLKRDSMLNISNEVSLKTYKEDKAGYAIIQTKENKYIIKSLEFFIGRECKKKSKSKSNVILNEKNDKKQQLYRICSSDKVSRISIRIYFNGKDWYLQNLSLNTVYVNKQQIKIEDYPIALENINTIQIGTNFKCYFIKSTNN